MGKLETGILGKSTGKVGPVITANWRSLNIVKAYFKPSNPRTPDQQAQRNKFTVAVDLTRSVLTTIVKPIWDKLSDKMSGYNLFIQSLLSTMDADKHPVPSTLVSKGTLLSSSIISATYDGTEVQVNFVNNSGVGNAQSTDSVSLLIYDKASRSFIRFFSNTSQRSAGQISGNIGSGYSFNNLIAYIFFRQIQESGPIYSDSVGVNTSHS